MTSRQWISGTLLAATLLSAHADARAQGGGEAAAGAAQAADWAKRQKESGSAPGVTTTRTVSGAKPAGTNLPARPARKPSGAPGVLSGMVVERDTGRGVPNVLLRLVSTEPEYAVETKLWRTDSTGRWVFTGVEPGTWSLSVDSERLPRTFAVAEGARTIKVARRDSQQLRSFTLYRTACVEGHVQWSDGYVFSDAPVVVAPRRPALPPAEGRVNGVGDYEICSAPADSVMVWVGLRDGRRIGRPVSLAVGRAARVDFRLPAETDMPGTTFLLSAKTASGSKVPFARVVMVGRRIGVANEPWVIYQRDATANRDGEVLARVPYGTYEILGWNPREGEWGRIEQFVIARGAGDQVTHDVTLRGTSTDEEQAAWRQALLDRADNFQFSWVP